MSHRFYLYHDSTTCKLPAYLFCLNLRSSIILVKPRPLIVDIYFQIKKSFMLIFKQFFTTAILIVSFVVSISAQTNTFPSSGSAGIGTTSPNSNSHLDINNGTNGKLKVGYATYVGSTEQGWSANAAFGRNIYTNDSDNVRSLFSSVIGSQYIYMYNSGISFHVSGGSVTAGNNIYNEVGRMTTTGISTGAYNPRYKLDVIGDARFGDYNMNLASSGGLGIRIGLIDNSFTSLNSTDAFIGVANSGFAAGLSGDLLIVPRSTTGVNNSIRFFSGPTTPAERVIIDYLGNVGIGTTSPNSNAKLDVNGNIFTNGKIAIGTTDMTKIDTNLLAVNGTAIFKRAKVKAYSIWPDYVFEDNYNLPSLKYLANYIKLNKHLPDMPSAADVAENGIDLGDNQALLLKKVEELTLLIIELDKKLELCSKKSPNKN